MDLIQYFDETLAAVTVGTYKNQVKTKSPHTELDLQLINWNSKIKK